MATTEGDAFPLSRGVIWALCLGATPLAGAVLYYVWKRDHLDAANYANRVSFASWALWIVGYVLLHRM